MILTSSFLESSLKGVASTLKDVDRSNLGWNLLLVKYLGSSS
ncbi:protein of unknown function [Shewanella benthica]|uniref:Uncharacterized protein n=1 Tax=Shewanella benthica TaxID=43661 RepID=A0A330LZ41_9GAMM|nr:protein of unknown function [Shewanella benthica]